MGKKRIGGKTKAERTKEQIFRSALDLFRTYGFEHVTIQQITDHAGTAKGSFYTYFKTKSDIIVEEFWEIDAFYRSIADTVRAQKTAKERLQKFTELQMLYVRDVIGCKMLKILYANQVSKDGSEKVIIDKNRFWYTFIVDIIEEGQKANEFINTIKAEKLAGYFNTAMRGMLLDWNISSGSFDLVKASLNYCNILILNMIKS